MQPQWISLSSYCRSSASFSLFFSAILSVKTHTVLPVDRREIRTMQKISGIWIKQDLRGTSFV